MGCWFIMGPRGCPVRLITSRSWLPAYASTPTGRNECTVATYPPVIARRTVTGTRRRRAAGSPMAIEMKSAPSLRDVVQPLTRHAHDYDSLLDSIGDARIVLLGEASHGTHEFYRERARITRRLIEEKSFVAVAVEADWPDAYRVNRWVRCVGDDPGALAALGDFQRFPRWMWRNTDVLAFIEWLRGYNQGAAPDQRAGFYGLDLYSLFSSIEAVIGFLDRVDPEAARRARYRYGCFED